MAAKYERIEQSNGSYGIVRRKSNGTYCAEFRLSSDTPAKYVKITVGGDGQENVQNPRAARKHAHISVSRRIAELEKNKTAPSGKPLRLSDLSEVAIAYKEKNNAAFGTLAAYRGAFRRILGDQSLPAMLPNLEIADVTEQNMIDLSDRLSKNFHGNTVNQTLKFFKAAWNILHETRVDYRQYPNPVNMKKHGVKVKNAGKKDLYPDQVRAVFETAQTLNSPERYIPLIHLTFGSGLRIGEALQLRGVDVQEDEDGVYINVSPKEFEGDIDLEGKSEKATRTLHVSEEVGAILKSRKAQAQLLGTPWIFWSPKDMMKPLTQSAATAYCDGLFKETNAGLKTNKINLAGGGGKELKWHAFRHTFASVQLKAGMPLDRLSEILGHSTIEITHRYYHHLVPKDESKVAALNTAKWLQKESVAA